MSSLFILHYTLVRDLYRYLTDAFIHSIDIDTGTHSTETSQNWEFILYSE